MNISFGLAALAAAFASFYACVEGYLLLRALSQRITDKPRRKMLLWIFWPVFLLGAGLYFYFSYSTGALRSLYSLAASYWGLFILIPFFILSDILCLGGVLFSRASGKANGRAFGKTFGLRVRIIVLALAAVTIVSGSFAARFPTVTRYCIAVEKPLPKNGLRVILVSDLHIGSMVHKKELRRIVSGINSLGGDLVFIAGDINDRDMEVYKKENLNGEMAGIKAPLGVYAVPGNHDYFGGVSGELKQYLAAAGIKLLVDEAVLVDDAFYVIGRNDLSVSRRGPKRKPLSELIKNLDSSLPLIVMDHQPMNLGEAEAAGIDLQVSG
ncbi:MAG: metallophosphoesterase, partial [Treponema sp.]|nr:metallophosphoesterase [Treponema sp.]